MASICRLSEGRYQITWLEGYIEGSDGKHRERKRSAIVWGGPQDAKRRAAKTEAQRVPASKLRHPDERTVAEWLNRRKEEVNKGQLEEKTWRGYEQVLLKYAIPAIGQVPLNRLQPAQVEALYHGMPGASARMLHAALRQILRWALKKRWIGWDVGVMVSPPRHRPEKRPPVPLEHLARILAGFQRTRWLPLIAVAVAAGLRAGELLGLRWVDVDWHQKALWICRALKKPGDSPVFGTRKNDEEIPVAVHDSVLEILRQHKEFQDAERARYKEDWGLVFAATDGSPVDASNFLDRWWHPVLRTFVEPG